MRSATTRTPPGSPASTSRTLKTQAFALGGGLAGVASLVWIGQYGSARGDNADGSILLVVTAVVLGGIDINGGRGSMVGVVLALFLLGTIRNGMGLANMAGPTQTVVLGALLIIGVLRPLIGARHRATAPAVRAIRPCRRTRKEVRTAQSRFASSLCSTRRPSTDGSRRKR